ncbi:MAG: hypothetical protein ACRDE8_01275, partial [Ginsengibacter sp.]
MPANKPVIDFIANNAEVMILWKYPVVINNCWGFSIYKKKEGESGTAAEPLISSVGFEGDTHSEWETEPTTVWPIQGYQWIDYTVKEGEVVAYKVIPMIHTTSGLTKDENSATDWSSWITVKDDPKTTVSFNRGLVASQFMAKALKGATTPG